MTDIRDLSELDRQIDNAEAHALDQNAPGRKWDQRQWIAPCGTYGCLAGNTVLDAGLTVVDNTWGFGFIGFEIKETGENVFDAARRILGLTADESWMLFNMENTIDDLRAMQKNLHNGRPIREGLDD